MPTNNTIDLRTCVPGQNLERRDGALATYERKFTCSTDYPHLIDGESYTDDGYYRLSKTEDEWDIVKILPLNKSTTEIDLRICVPGQIVERRDGTRVTYESEFKCSIDFPHLIGGKLYTNNGYYRLNRTEDEWDIVRIFPVKKSESKINLNTCVPGQKVKLRNGSIVEYQSTIACGDYTHRINDGNYYMSNGSYWNDDPEHHLDVIEILPMEYKPVIDLRTCVPGQKVRLRDGRIVAYKIATDSAEYPHQFYGGGTYTDEGYYWLDKARSDSDVMEILPMEKPKPKPKLDLNTCVPGQKVKLRNGKIVTYGGLINENKIYTHSVDGYSHVSDGSFWNDGRTSSKDVVEILPMEEEPVKTPTELTHSITDQIDVTSPDHVSIIPQPYGVLISIKKGLTTISWRHYNH